MDKAQKVSVLYVEDEEVMRENIGEILHDRAGQLYLAGNGVEGFEIYEKKRPDIIICDINMPEMNGLEMARKIKALNPYAQIIVTTAYSEPEYFVDAIQIGINSFVLKPIDFEMLFKEFDRCADAVYAERCLRAQNEQVRRYSQNLERLMTLSREITFRSDLKTLYRTILQGAKDILDLDLSTLLLLSPHNNVLLMEDSIGFEISIDEGFSLAGGAGLASYVVKSRTPGIINDFKEETRFEVPAFVKEKGIRSALCVPMLVDHEVLGALIGHACSPREFPDDEISLYQNIGNLAAIAIRNSTTLDNLIKSEKKLRYITSSLGEGLYVLDINEHINFMNPEAERLLGWTQEEIQGKNVHKLIHFMRTDGPHLFSKECPMRHVIETGRQFFSSDEVFIRKDGTSFPVSVLSSPITEDGKVVASVTVFRDITDLKRLEEEVLKAKKLESIGVLAGGIAHDFNNLLQAIMGHISLSKLYISPGNKAYDQLTSAENASERAKELSYRLLTFAKGGEPLRQVISITDLLKETVTQAVNGSGVTVECDIPNDLAPVEVDTGQIRQVVRNIVLNAAEAMSKGGNVSVSVRNVMLGNNDGLPLNEGEYLLISVSDNGVGIPEVYITRIFDPYFTTKPMGSSKGMGLGLAICHSIIKKHQGHITVTSKVGKGTTFNIYLPTFKVLSKVMDRDREVKTDERRRILVMDDEERVREISREMLIHFGYEVELVSNGKDALEFYRTEKEKGARFDAVILDLTVPGGMGGDEAIMQLLKIDPEVRAIVSSGYVDDPLMKDFSAYGFSGAIAKPYRMDQLHETLNKVLA